MTDNKLISEAEREYQRRLDDDVEIDDSYLKSTPDVPIGDNISFNSGKLINDDADPNGEIVRVGDFLAPPRCIGLGCARDNVGKTAFGVKLTSLLTQHGIHCLYLLGDQLKPYLNPYLRKFGVDQNYFYLHSFRRYGISLFQLKKLLKNYKEKRGKYPEFIAIDSGSDFEIDAQLSFMPFKKQKQERFNYNEMSHILYCYRHLLYPLAEGDFTEGNPVSIFQYKHMSKGSFDVPHSYKQPAMVEVAWLLYNQQTDFSKAPLDQKGLLAELCQIKEKSWAIYGRKTRFGENRSYYVGLSDPVKKDCYQIRRGYYVSDFKNLRTVGDTVECSVFDDDLDDQLLIDRVRKLYDKRGNKSVPLSSILDQLKSFDRKEIESRLRDLTHSGQLDTEEFGHGKIKYRPIVES